MKNLLLSLVFFSLCTGIQAQKVGIGFLAGAPTGISLQFRQAAGMSPDILLAYDFDDYLFVNVHGLWFKNLESSGRLDFFYGPGVFGAVRPRNRYRDDWSEGVVGFSGNFGLSYTFERIDLFLQITPRLGLLPGTGFDVGGGVGLRFLL
jgi:hypothetical protein